MTVHPAARSFGGVAEAYERGRPLFPPVVVDHMVSTLGLRPGRRVLDLAAGTGKLTRDLLASGAEVVAVEPSAGMREVFHRVLPDVPILDGSAEAIPLDDASVHAITVAQAFHWFDPEPAFAEMRRVLQADGRVVLVWNVRDGADPVGTASEHIVDRHRGATPSHRVLDLAGAIAASPFEQIGLREWPWSHDVDEQTFLDRFLSVSVVAALPPDERAAVTTELRTLFATHEAGGMVSLDYTSQTHVLALRRP